MTARDELRERLLDALVAHQARGVRTESAVNVVADDIVDDALLPVMDAYAAQIRADERRRFTQPDNATVARVAEAIRASHWAGKATVPPWEHARDSIRKTYRREARAALAAMGEES
jgi:hypothetical protein